MNSTPSMPISGWPAEEASAYRVCTAKEGKNCTLYEVQETGKVKAWFAVPKGIREERLRKMFEDDANEERRRAQWPPIEHPAACRVVDKDGTVSLHEVRVFLRNFGMSPLAAEKFFRALDKDGSGSIKYDEFIALFDTTEKNQKKSVEPQLVLRRLT